VAGGKRVVTKGVPATEDALQRTIEKLERPIGQQAVVREVGKTTDDLVGGGGLSARREESQWLLCRATGGPRPGGDRGRTGCLGPGAAGTDPPADRGPSLLGLPPGGGLAAGLGRPRRE